MYSCVCVIRRRWQKTNEKTPRCGMGSRVMYVSSDIINLTILISVRRLTFTYPTIYIIFVCVSLKSGPFGPLFFSLDSLWGFQTSVTSTSVRQNIILFQCIRAAENITNISVRSGRTVMKANVFFIG